MQVSATILLSLKEAILSTHSQDTFIPFADVFSLKSGVDYQSDVPGNTFRERTYSFLQILNKKGCALTFINDYSLSLNPSQRNFLQVQEVLQKVDEFFKCVDGEWKINNHHFENCLIKKHFAFLDRSALRKAVRKLISNMDSPVLVLKGQPKAGLSYIRFFISEIESSLELFKMIDVDLKHRVSTYSNGLIYAAHICQVIAEKIDMDYVINMSNPEQFKIYPFLNKLKIFLNGKDQLHLFFLDQFDTPMADDCYALINGLASLPLEGTRILLVLSGYDRSNNWDFYLAQNSNEVDIEDGNLNKQHVDEFLEQVYTHLSKKIPDLSFSKDDFLKELEPMVQDAIFLAPGANAEAVGQHLSKWYKGFYEKLN